MRLRGLRLRLAGLFALAIAPGFIAETAYDFREYRTQAAEATADLLNRVRTMASRESGFLALGIVNDADLGALSERLDALALERGTVIAVLDGEGRLLAGSPAAEARIGSSLPPEVQPLLARGEGVGTTTLRDGSEWTLAFARLGPASDHALILALAADARAITAAAWRNLWGDLAILAGVTILGVAVALRFGRRWLVLPISALERAALRIGAGEPRVRVDGSFRPDELGRVAAAFDRMARELDRREEELRKADAYKTRMLAVASHDLRQPLTVIRMAHEMIARGLWGPAGRRHLARAEAAAERLRHQLDLIAEASRLDLGNAVAKVGPVALAPFLAEITAEHRDAAARKGLVLRVAGSSVVVASDREMLASMLRNLIDNAVKYTDRGGVLVGCRRRGTTVAIEVHDTGVGIAPERREEIFAEFHQLDPRREGLGLGLSIVRRTAELLGHRLELRSIEGTGSCFAIVVPLAECETAAAPTRLSSA